MTRTVRARGAIAVVAAAALGVFGASVGSEPSWDSAPAGSVLASPGEPSWDSAPAVSVTVSLGEPSWDSAPTAALGTNGEPSWDFASVGVEA